MTSLLFFIGFLFAVFFILPVITFMTAFLIGKIWDYLDTIL